MYLDRNVYRRYKSGMTNEDLNEIQETIDSLRGGLDDLELKLASMREKKCSPKRTRALLRKVIKEVLPSNVIRLSSVDS